MKWSVAGRIEQLGYTRGDVGMLVPVGSIPLSGMTARPFAHVSYDNADSYLTLCA